MFTIALKASCRSLSRLACKPGRNKAVKPIVQSMLYLAKDCNLTEWCWCTSIQKHWSAAWPLTKHSGAMHQSPDSLEILIRIHSAPHALPCVKQFYLGKKPCYRLFINCVLYLHSNMVRFHQQDFNIYNILHCDTRVHIIFILVDGSHKIMSITKSKLNETTAYKEHHILCCIIHNIYIQSKSSDVWIKNRFHFAIKA